MESNLKVRSGTAILVTILRIYSARRLVADALLSVFPLTKLGRIYLKAEF